MRKRRTAEHREAICKACGDALRRGELRGAVIWKETPDHG